MSVKSYRKLALLVVVLTAVSLLGAPVTSQATPICNLDDCNDFCNQVCEPNGGVPWTCQWSNMRGACYGICWCFV